MKTKFGAIIVDGRGKINGMVASKNRAGSYMRTKVTPVNPRSTFQSAVRNRLTSLAQGFRALTAAQIAAWNNAVSNFAKTDIFGDLKNPSGFNLYVRLNANLLGVSESAISNPPLPGAVYAPTSLSVAMDVGAGGYALTFSGAIPATDKVILLATPGLSPGRSFSKNQFRVIEVLENGDSSPYDFETSYLAKFGAPAVGQKVFVAMQGVNITTGQQGIALSASTIVVST
jgi:hypothetical protein